MTTPGRSDRVGTRQPAFKRWQVVVAVAVIPGTAIAFRLADGRCAAAATAATTTGSITLAFDLDLRVGVNSRATRGVFPVTDLHHDLLFAERGGCGLQCRRKIFDDEWRRRRWFGLVLAVVIGRSGRGRKR